MKTRKHSDSPIKDDQHCQHQWSIRNAHLNETHIISALYDFWSDDLQPITKAQLSAYTRLKQALILRINQDFCGFLLWIPSIPDTLIITALAITPARLRKGLATHLLDIFTMAALDGHFTSIKLTCKSDLPANNLWPKHG